MTFCLLLFQRSFATLQCCDGLHDAGSVRVELWHSSGDLLVLEGTVTTPAGLPHRHLSSAGARLHQIHARLDYMGLSWTSLSLGCAELVHITSSYQVK